MPRIKSRIKHDYKKPGPVKADASLTAHPSSRRGRWFIVGAVLPITVSALALWQSQTGTAPPSTAAALKSEATPWMEAASLDARTRAPIVLPLPQPLPGLLPAAPVEEKTGEQVVLTIKSGDTLDELFKKNTLSRADLGQILKLKNARAALSVLKPGDTVEISHDHGRVLELARKLDETKTLKIEPSDENKIGFSSRIVEKPVEIRVQHAKGIIDSSLFLSAQQAGISDNLIMNLAGIFAWDVDFVLDIRRGDSFAMVFEEIWQDGHFVRNGEILAAEFNNNGDLFRAVRYADPDGKTGYFTPEGLNVKKAFLRAPIAFTPRVTSSFNPKRYHPVHKKVRPHRGVDYGAPKGTPIKSAGDGKVIFRGRKNGYGNTIIVQHGGNITTLYGHMSKYNGNARVGRRVKQGQTIGYVGSTGTATGNHLHYEYRVSGVHRNPRTVKLPQAQPVPTKYKDDFIASTRRLINHLAAVSKTQRLALAD